MKTPSAHLKIDPSAKRQTPPSESWWISSDGRLPADKRAEAQVRMGTTIATAYRTANGE